MAVINVVPTVIRDRLYAGGASRYPMQLVDQRFNASTWYAGFLTDVGIAGAIVIVALLQCVAAWTYMHARRGEAWVMLAYAPVFEGLALSIFADTGNVGDERGADFASAQYYARDRGQYRHRPGNHASAR